MWSLHACHRLHLPIYSRAYRPSEAPKRIKLGKKARAKIKTEATQKLYAIEAMGDIYGTLMRHRLITFGDILSFDTRTSQNRMKLLYREDRIAFRRTNDFLNPQLRDDLAKIAKIWPPTGKHSAASLPHFSPMPSQPSPRRNARPFCGGCSSLTYRWKNIRSNLLENTSASTRRSSPLPSGRPFKAHHCSTSGLICQTSGTSSPTRAPTLGSCRTAGSSYTKQPQIIPPPKPKRQ